MRHLGRVLGYGFASWIIALAISFLVYPLKTSGDPLFETVMTLVVTTLAVGATLLHFRGLTGGFLREGIRLGAAMLLVNIVLDQPLFLAGPMAMPFVAYMKDIGLTYLVYPIVTVAGAMLLRGVARGPAQGAFPQEEAPRSRAEAVPS